MTRTVLKDGFLAYFDAQEARINAFCTLDKSLVENGNSAFFAVKDNIAVKGMEMSSGSEMLRGFVSPYSAHAVQKLEAAGYKVIGKTNTEEFGLGSGTDSSVFGPSHNPWLLGDASANPVAAECGMPSADGGAAAVAAGLVPFALGSDSGGSLRRAAAFCGVSGFKPTQGSVSGYGLSAMASSMETIAIISAGSAIAKEVFGLVRGHDPMNMQSMNWPESAQAGPKKMAAKTKKIGVLDLDALCKSISSDLGIAAGRLLGSGLTEVYGLWAEKFRELGYEIVMVDVPAMRYASQAYHIIASALTSANLARFDGIRYGFRDKSAESHEEVYTLSRRYGFGKESLLQILLGTHVLGQENKSAFYYGAEKLRSLIMEDYKTAFAACDAILSPVNPQLFYGTDHAGAEKEIAHDFLLAGPSLAGLPAVVFQGSMEATGKAHASKMPVGAQLCGPAFSDELLLELAAEYEKANPPAHPKGYKEMWRLA